MEEIKVGEYVRTIDGYIRKVEQVNKKGSYNALCHGAYSLDIPYKYSQGVSAKKIKSHSFNIIDLIEVGDYVNGYKVLHVGNDYVDIDCNKPSEDTYFFDNQIKSIVTKEEFKNKKYRI